MTAATSDRWRSRWPTQDAARRYLGTVQDPARRQELADFLGVELPEKTVVFVKQTAALTNQPQSIKTEIPSLSAAPDALRLTLPYPPSLNSIWRSIVMTVRGKPQVHVLLSEKGREYRRTVLRQVEQAGSPATPAGSRLALHLQACPPDHRARDLSNLPKALEDALTHAKVWADDSLIDRLIVERGPVIKGGRVHVTITPLDATLFGGEA